MSKQKVVIGARGSALSLKQAEAVSSFLRTRFSSLDFEFRSIVTRGDRIKQELSTAEIGVFVKEIEEALLRGEIDMAVHSLKDLPVCLAGGLKLGAVTRRLSANDVLISREGIGLDHLPAGAVIATSSVRRRAQLLSRRRDISLVSIRGNIDTRLRKLNSDPIDGIICAFCALQRLGLEQRASEILSPDIFLPAPGQGALGIEIRSDDQEMIKIAGCLNDRDTFLSVSVERDFLNALGGGCHLPLGALATIEGDMLQARGCVVCPDGARMIRVEKKVPLDQAGKLGKVLAEEAIVRGAKEILDECRKSSE